MSSTEKCGSYASLGGSLHRNSTRGFLVPEASYNFALGQKLKENNFGSVFHQNQIWGYFGKIPYAKPCFGVRSAEVAINCLGVYMILLALFHARNAEYTNSTYTLYMYLYIYIFRYLHHFTSRNSVFMKYTRYAYPTCAVYTVPMIYHALFK